MTVTLTPDREQEIREWLDVMLAAQVGTATGAPNYGDMARLLAALDAARAERDEALASRGRLQEMYRKCSYERQAVEREVAALREALERVPEFSRWTQHHPTCKRRTVAGNCSCGLIDLWREVANRVALAGQDETT